MPTSSSSPEVIALDRVRRLPGVLRAEWISREERELLRTLATPRAAENRGIEEALARDRVLVLFKDPSFRLPPEPTILLLDDAGTVIGRELLGDENLPDGDPRKVVQLGKGFLLFRDRGRGPGFRFFLPAVRFPELEGILGLADVISASPDPPQDEHLKKRFGVRPGKEFASILVGFDLRNP